MNTRKTLVVALAAASTLSIANPFFMATDMMSYEISMTRYGSLSDAQAQTNALQTFSLSDPATNDRRDMGTYFVKDVATFDTDHAAFLTAWYYTTNPSNGAYSGWGNPNNTNTGFIQMFDSGAATTSAMSGSWSVLNVGVGGGSTFTMSASGGNAGASEFARLWHGAVGGPGNLTGGTFHSYDFNLTASGLTADWDATHGLYAAYNHPAMVSGGFSGIFENTGADSQYHGFYSFSGVLNETSWAFANSADLNGAFFDSAFGAVPEPATMTVLVLAAVAGLRRQKRN